MAANAGGPTTTPKNVMKLLAPVTAPALPGGAMRATSASCTPFHPTAVAPKTTAIATTAAAGHAGCASASAAAHAAATTPISASTRRGALLRSASAPQPMRPVTPASVVTVSRSPAATSVQPSVSATNTTMKVVSDTCTAEEASDVD